MSMIQFLKALFRRLFASPQPEHTTHITNPHILMVVNGHTFSGDPDALIRTWQFPRRHNISRGGFR